MRLLYVPSGADYCPVLAITEFTPADVLAMREAVAALARGDREAVALDGLVSGDVHLDLCVASSDLGVSRTPPKFSCLLTRQSWMDVHEMLAPFLVEEPNCYQWLADSDDVSLLISYTGKW